MDILYIYWLTIMWVSVSLIGHGQFELFEADGAAVVLIAAENEFF